MLSKHCCLVHPDLNWVAGRNKIHDRMLEQFLTTNLRHVLITTSSKSNLRCSLKCCFEKNQNKGNISLLHYEVYR